MGSARIALVREKSMRPKWLLQRDALPAAVELLDQAGDAIGFPTATVPDYLNAHYWWAYIHPKAVKVFERQWLVNFILWGNYARLRDAALAELGEVLSGSTLQVVWFSWYPTNFFA